MARARSTQRVEVAGDAEYAAGVNYEQFEEVDWSTVDVDPTDEEIEDAGRNGTLQMWARLFTKYYKEVATRKSPASARRYSIDMTLVIASRPGRQRWETNMAAMIQVIAIFFPDESGFDPAKLRCPVKTKETAEKSAGGEDAELEALEAWDQKYAHLLNFEVYQRLNTVWDIWNQVIPHAQKISSRAFAKDGYGRVHGTPWIEFVGLATVIAKQYKNMVKSNNSEPGADYAKARFLIPVSLLRRYLRSKINKSGFRREQKHWVLCWDVVAEKEGLVVGKSNFMDDTFAWPDEPELEIDVEREAESESDGDRESVEVESEEVDV